MQIDMQQQGRHARLQISGELTIYDAVALYRALLESLGTCDSLELDLAAVTDLDAAGLQQLMLLRREARATGKTLRVLAHSDATRDVPERYGSRHPGLAHSAFYPNLPDDLSRR